MESSSENIEISSEIYGSLIFFLKDGTKMTRFHLTEGPTTIGSSKDSDIRLKLNVDETHCIVIVNENGNATIINKSERAPIKVNGIIVRKSKVLSNEDIIEIFGKKCQYLNENILNKNIQTNEKVHTKKILRPSSNRRNTIAPAISSLKKLPKTKIPVQVQRFPRRKSVGYGVTPEKKADMKFRCEKSKTTSKLAVSKALGASTRFSKRRLSLGHNRQQRNTTNSTVSARNIIFHENVIMKEEDEKPSLSMKMTSKPKLVNKKLESVRRSSIMRTESTTSSDSGGIVRLKLSSCSSVSAFEDGDVSSVSSELGDNETADECSEKYNQTRRDSQQRSDTDEEKSPSPQATRRSSSARNTSSIKGDRYSAEVRQSCRSSIVASKSPISEEPIALEESFCDSYIDDDNDESEPESRLSIENRKSPVGDNEGRITSGSEGKTVQTRNTSSRKSLMSDLQSDLCLSLEGKTPESQKIPRKSSVANFQDITLPLADETDHKEEITLHLSDKTPDNSPLDDESSKLTSSRRNRKSSVGRFPENASLSRRSSGDESNSVESSINSDQSLDKEESSLLNTPEAKKDSSMRRSSISEEKTSQRRNTSLVKSRKSLVSDLQNDSTLPLEVKTPESKKLIKSSVANLEDTTVPLADKTPVPRNLSSLMNIKSLTDDNEDCSSPLVDRTPVPRSRSSVKSRKSCIVDDQGESTLYLADETVDNSPVDCESSKLTSSSSRKNRKSSVGHFCEDVSLSRRSSIRKTNDCSINSDDESVCEESGINSNQSLDKDESSLLNTPAPNKDTSIKRSSRLEEKTSQRRNTLVKSRKSLVSDLQNDSALPLEGKTPEPQKLPRKSSVANLQDITLPLADKTPVPRNQLSLRSSTRKTNDCSINSDDESVCEESGINSNQSLGKDESSLLNTPAPNEDSSMKRSSRLEEQTSQRNNTSLVKSRKSLVSDLQNDSALSLEGKTPEPQKLPRESSVANLQDITLPLADKTPVPRNQLGRRTSTRKINDCSIYSDNESVCEESGINSNQSLDKDESSLLNTPAANTDNSLKRSSRSEEKTLQRRNTSLVKSRKSLNSDLQNDSTLPLDEKTPEPKKLPRKSSVAYLQDITLPLADKTPVPRDRSSLMVTKSLGNDNEGSFSPLVDRTPAPRSRSSVKSRKSCIVDDQEESTLYLADKTLNNSPVDNESSKLTSSSSRRNRKSSVGRFREDVSLSRRSSTRKANDCFMNSDDESVCVESSINSNQSLDEDDSSMLNTPDAKTDSSMRKSSRYSSFNKSENVKNIHLDSTYDIDNIPSEDLTEVASKTPLPRRRSVRRCSKFGESYTISVVNSTSSEDYPSQVECDDSIWSDKTRDIDSSITPELSRSSRRNNKSSSNYSRFSVKSGTPEVNRSLSVRKSTTENEMLGETLESTPENNTSIVFIDSPLDESCKSSHVKLSKTMQSTIEEVDLSTPKSAIKSRRRKSMPYQPETEDITPVTPIDQEDEGDQASTGIKTPLNTPGLFENIRKSVLESRSRLKFSSFKEELKKAKSDKKASKRPRESYGESIRTSKRRKLIINEDDSFELLDESFGSFQSDEALTDISTSNISQDTPINFSDLTDKPVITHPRTRFSTGTRTKKLQSTRRSLPSDSIWTGDIDTNTSDKDHLQECSVESSEMKVKKLQKSPNNDLTNVSGIKNLLKSPRVEKSPKKDLRDVKRIKKGLKSPKNDLSDVAGVKKLLTTPKEIKSPKNDLRNIIGVKKLLTTPKEQNSPENDLTNVPNLRKIMSPRYQNSPLNDLSDLRGVKNLMRSPKESKDLNVSSNLEGVAEIFNISGIHRLSNTSDIENNEELFDKLVDRKPLRTYRGKSFSPNKIVDSYGARRRTVGDQAVTSPRVEDWVKNQAVIKLERLRDVGAGDESEAVKDEIKMDSASKRTTRRKVISPVLERTTRRRKVEKSEVEKEPIATKSKKGKKTIEDNSDETTIDSIESPRTTRMRKVPVVVERVTRGRKRLAEETEDISEKSKDSSPVERVLRATRGKKNAQQNEELVEPIVEKATRSRRKAAAEPEPAKVANKNARGRRKAVDENLEESLSESIQIKKQTSEPKTNRKPTNDVAESEVYSGIEEPAEVTKKPVRGKKKGVDENLGENIESKKTISEPKTNRKPANDVESEISSGIEEPAKVTKKPVRGKKKAVDENLDDSGSIEFKKIIRETKTNRKTANDVGESEISSGIEEPAQVTKKPVRGRKKAVDENIDDSESIEFKNPISEPKTNRKPTNNAAESEISSGIEEPEKVTKKPARGRKKAVDKNLDDSLSKSIDSKNTISKSKTNLKPTDDETSTGIEETVPSKDSEEETVTRTVKGRKTKKSKSSNDDNVNDKPAEKRSKRTRKVSSDESFDVVVEAQKEIENVEDKKVIKSRTKKAQPKNDLSDGVENTRSARGRKQATKNKQVEDEQDEPVRMTRGRRKMEIEVIAEEDEKEEELVERPKRARSAKNKVIEKLEITEEDTSSPRTRAVKGNFNKYGSSFEVESPGKATRRRKVHFE